MGLVKQQELRDMYYFFYTYVPTYIYILNQNISFMNSPKYTVYLPRSVFPTTNNIISRNCFLFYFTAKFE